MLTFLMAVTLTAQPRADVRSFDSNGVPINYVDRGRGQAVLLLHGFGGSLKQWEPKMIPRLIADGFRVIAYDARGHGSSGKPDAPGQYGQEDVNDAVRLLDQLSIDRAHVVGYSRGASIASRLVAQQPRRVRSVVFGGWGVGNPVETLDPSERAAAAVALERGEPPMPLLRALTPIGAPVPLPAARPGGIAPLDVRKALAAAFRAEGQTRRATTEDLKAADVPALAIVGELDGMAPSVKAMASRMPKLKVIVISGANHFTAAGDGFLEGAAKFLRDRSESREPLGRRTSGCTRRRPHAFGFLERLGSGRRG